MADNPRRVYRAEFAEGTAIKCLIFFSDNLTLARDHAEHVAAGTNLRLLSCTHLGVYKALSGVVLGWVGTEVR